MTIQTPERPPAGDQPLGERLAKLEGVVEGQNHRLEVVDRRLDAIDRRLDALQKSVEALRNIIILASLGIIATMVADRFF